jgi:hypothetical protein
MVIRSVTSGRRRRGPLLRRPRAAARAIGPDREAAQGQLYLGRWVRGHDGRDREVASAEQAPRPAATEAVTPEIAR